MGKEAMPDHQVACLRFNGSEFEPGDVRLPWIAVGRLSLYPFFKSAMKTGNNLQSALFGGRIHQAEHALNVEWQGAERCINVPVNEAGKVPIGS